MKFETKIGAIAGLYSTAMNVAIFGASTLVPGLLGVAAGLLLVENGDSLQDAVRSSRRFCEGRDAKPEELALVRYHADAETI